MFFQMKLDNIHMTEKLTIDKNWLFKSSSECFAMKWVTGVMKITEEATGLIIFLHGSGGIKKAFATKEDRDSAFDLIQKGMEAYYGHAAAEGERAANVSRASIALQAKIAEHVTHNH